MTGEAFTAPKPLHPYYSFDRLFSYNAFLMFVIGARGLGKTYGAKKKAFARGIRTGEQFIYLRRHENEIKETRPTFFDDIAHEFPEHDFRAPGREIQVASAASRDDKKRVWTTIGFFAYLSTAQSMKGKSFHKVTLIMFDEFIIEKGLVHYLPDEVTIFLNFYSTVDRWKDKTRVLFMANSVSIMNPYFAHFKIDPNDGEWQTHSDGDIVAHFAKSEDFKKSVLKTRFGKFIDGSQYGEYAAGNQFSDNHKNMLRLKGSKAIYQFTLHTSKGAYSIWHTYGVGEYYVQEKRPKLEMHYCLNAEQLKEGMILLTFADIHLQVLRAAFRRAQVYSDNPQTRNAMIEIFDRK